MPAKEERKVVLTPEEQAKVAQAETDTILPEGSAVIRAMHPRCYFPACFCEDRCQFAPHAQR